VDLLSFFIKTLYQSMFITFTLSWKESAWFFGCNYSKLQSEGLKASLRVQKDSPQTWLSAMD
jgi:hypothetical protein